MINELLTDIYNLKISLPVKAGFRPIENWKGTGIDVVVTRPVHS
jgi:CxxC motif-containing protein